MMTETTAAPATKKYRIITESIWKDLIFIEDENGDGDYLGCGEEIRISEEQVEFDTREAALESVKWLKDEPPYQEYLASITAKVTPMPKTFKELTPQEKEAGFRDYAENI